MSKTARNPITNDLIKSKNSTETFDRNFDQIDWSVKLEPAQPELDPKVRKLLDEVLTDHADVLRALKD